MNTEQISTLKAGDRVACVHRHSSWGGLLSHRFGTVTKVSGHGHITVAAECAGDDTTEIHFDKRGDERGTKFGHWHLEDAARLERELERNARRQATGTVVNDIEAIVKGIRRGRDCVVSPAAKSKLLELVSSLETEEG